MLHLPPEGNHRANLKLIINTLQFKDVEEEGEAEDDAVVEGEVEGEGGAGGVESQGPMAWKLPQSPAGFPGRAEGGAGPANLQTVTPQGPPTTAANRTQPPRRSRKPERLSFILLMNKEAHCNHLTSYSELWDWRIEPRALISQMPLKWQKMNFKEVERQG